MSDKTMFGEYLDRQLRIRQTPDGRPWSMRELARAAGVSHATLSKVTRGLATPDVSTLERVARALEVPVLEVVSVALGISPTQQGMDADTIIVNMARRLADLPPELQHIAVDIVLETIAAMERVAENQQTMREELAQLKAKQQRWQDQNMLAEDAEVKAESRQRPNDREDKL